MKTEFQRKSVGSVSTFPFSIFLPNSDVFFVQFGNFHFTRDRSWRGAKSQGDQVAIFSRSRKRSRKDSSRGITRILASSEEKRGGKLRRKRDLCSSTGGRTRNSKSLPDTKSISVCGRLFSGCIIIEKSRMGQLNRSVALSCAILLRNLFRDQKTRLRRVCNCNTVEISTRKNPRGGDNKKNSSRSRNTV